MSEKYPDFVHHNLREYFKTIPKAAVAFSGGVDSGYLLYAAKVCGVDIHAYYVNSQLQPGFELDDAQRLAKQIGVAMSVIPLDLLSNDAVAGNRLDRCYHCKKLIMAAIMAHSESDGYHILMDGSNLSDDVNDRPGMQALKELKVISPLRDAELTKAQVREYSRMAGLFTWNKPAYACLATRIPAGIVLTNEMLKKIENAEDSLAQMGFRDFRVRVMGFAAKIQLPAEQIPLATQHHDEIVKKLSPWFSEILLDLKAR